MEISFLKLWTIKKIIKKSTKKLKDAHKVSQFLSENSNNLIVETSIKFWSKIYNILGYMEKVDFLKIWGVFSMKNVKNRQ